MVYIYYSFLIHSSADGHLGCFHVLAMINSAVMNIGVHMSLSDLVSLVCMPRSGIAGLDEQRQARRIDQKATPPEINPQAPKEEQRKVSSKDSRLKPLKFKGSMSQEYW